MFIRTQPPQEKNIADGGSTLHVHREHHEMVPVWFFIGVLLLFYGVVIFIVGVTEFERLPPVVLAQYHASFWGGILLMAIGAFFTLRFLPRKGDRDLNSAKP